MEKLDWKITSNLDAALRKALGAEINGKIEKSKKEVESLINANINAQKERLMADLKKHRSNLTDKITGYDALITKNRNTANSKLASGEANKKQTSKRVQGKTK